MERASPLNNNVMRNVKDSISKDDVQGSPRIEKAQNGPKNFSFVNNTHL